MSVKFNFLGDIGIFKKYENLNIDPFDKIKIPEADITVGNFEFIIPNNRKKLFFDVQEKYSCSYEYLNKLNLSKFHGFSLANNHCLDYGYEGVNDTINLLNNKDIKTFGFTNNNEYSIGYFKQNNLSFCIIAVVKKGRWSQCNFGYGPNEYDAQKVIDQIKQNKSEVNHVIVYPHWGTELVDIPDPRDVIDARKFIDCGASAVIGHHPHVSQGIEIYKNGIIAYSLGSFIYIHEEELAYSVKNKERQISICLTIEFSDKKVNKFKPTYYCYNFTTKLPQIINISEIKSYVHYLNNNINNNKEYTIKLRKNLIRREVNAFIQRFKSNQFKTVLYYISFLKIKHLLKLFGI